MTTHPITTRALTILLSLSLTAAGWSAPVAVAAPASTEVTSYGVPGVDYVEGEILVQYESPSQARVAAAVNNKGASTSEERIGAAVGKAARLKVKAGTSVGAAIKAIKAQTGVVSAQPNYIYTADEMAVTALSPNDPYFANYQWGLSNSGLLPNGPAAIAGIDIGAKQAWDTTTGSRDVVVAVVDTGVDYTHPDLAANMWQNPGEIPGNGIDDDGSGSIGGYSGSWGIDDVNGADFFSDDGDPMDAHAHGTHVAGTIGAVGNNNLGVSGVAWNLQIMAVRFMGADGQGSTFDGMLSVRYAAEEGADVINCSWGDVLNSETGESQSDVLLEQAIEDSGLLVVCAAGNGGTDGVGDNNDIAPFFPASRDVANIISVGAHTPDNAVARFSNYGLTSVDIFAPGYWIASTVPTWTRDGSDPTKQILYGAMSGTSMAAPHVAGVAALLLSEDGSLTPAELKEIILSSAVVSQGSPYANRCTTGGRLSAAAALDVLLAELGDLSGVARSALTGAPIAGATVSASGSDTTTTTASDGSFYLEGVREGSRTLTIDAPGYEQFTATVSVTAWATSTPFGSEGALLKLNSMTSAAATPFAFSGATTLSGQVRDELGGPVGNDGTVRITASKDGGRSWVTVGDAPVGPDGSWSFAYNPSVAYETIHQVRAAFQGTDVYGASSANAAITPLAYLSTPTVSVSSPRAGTKFTVRGYIGPRFAPSIIPARAYFYKRQSNGTYTLVKSVGLKTSYYSTTKTILSGATSLAARGTYRVRFMYGGTVKTYAGRLLGKTHGPWRYLTVR